MLNPESGYRYRLVSSKFSRRIIVLFLLSVVVPVGVITVISYQALESQLHSHSFEVSRQISKQIGMNIFERLSFARNQLQQTLHSSMVNAPENFVSIQNQLGGAGYYSSIQYLSPGIDAHQGQYRHLIDNLGQKRRTALDAGEIIVTIDTTDISDTSNSTQVSVTLMALAADHVNQQGVFIAVIDNDYLWDVGSLLPQDYSLAIYTSTRQRLFQSSPLTAAVESALWKEFAQNISATLTVGRPHDRRLLTYWTLFTEGQFDIADWVIVVSQSEGVALASIAVFKRYYFPIMAIVILCIALIASRQIRNRIQPLNRLADVTREYARGAFNNRADIAGDDEVSQLGQSFNCMADRLERQFGSLEVLAEIDHMILSSFDIRKITEIVFDQATRITHSEVVALIEFNKNHPLEAQCSTQVMISHQSIVEENIRLTAVDVQFLAQAVEGVRQVDAAGLPAYLPQQFTANAATALMLPLFVNDQLMAVLVFGYPDGYVLDEEEQALLGKFARHVAVALGNAMWEEKLYHQAHYDPLTDLPNRALLADRLSQAIARAQRDDNRVGLMFIDLDKFKEINDTQGHDTGDQLLKKIACQLVALVRSEDTVVRFGGDEFIIIISDIDKHEDIISLLQTLANKILTSIHQKINIGQLEVNPEASIGISVYPQDGKVSDKLIKNADTAMYHAKELGRNQMQFYADELNARTLERVKLEKEMCLALENDEFRLFYQPKMDVSGTIIIGAEALIRWQHPERGLIFPDSFIPLAEENGMIYEISQWVLRTACLQMNRWRKRGLAPICVAVNLASEHFQHAELSELILDTVNECELDTSALQLEITESAVLSEEPVVMENLNRLADAGLSIAVDDYGTGYSSLSYLHKLPVNTIKIDQSFVMGMQDDANLRAIVASTISLSHALGLSVVAEGVETEELHEQLKILGCDELQGYYFSKPIPTAEFELLHRNYMQAPRAMNFTAVDVQGRSA